MFRLIARLLFAASASIALIPAKAVTPSYPTQPIRLIVPYAAGQGTDVAARVIADQLTKGLGQAIVVDNRPGAGGNVGSGAVLNYPPDGYTVLMGTNATHVVNQFLYANIGYDPEADFAPVALVGLFPMAIVVPENSPYRTVSDVASAARKNPDRLNVGMSSTTARIVLELFKREAKAPLFGIAYKGSSSLVTDLVGGRLDLAVDTVVAVRPLLVPGKLRAVATTTLNSTGVLPGVSSVSEQGVSGFEITPWNALFVRRGTPPDRIQLLSAEIKRILQLPDVQKRLIELGIEPVYMDSAATADFMHREKEKWGRIVKENKITAD